MRPKRPPCRPRLFADKLQVFELLVSGRSEGEIAQQLALSPQIVSSDRARVLEKTATRTNLELVLYAMRWACGRGGVRHRRGLSTQHLPAHRPRPEAHPLA